MFTEIMSKTYNQRGGQVEYDDYLPHYGASNKASFPSTKYSNKQKETDNFNYGNSNANEKWTNQKVYHLSFWFDDKNWRVPMIENIKLE